MTDLRDNDAVPADARAAQLASEADARFQQGRHNEAYALYAEAAEISERAVEETPPASIRALALLMGNAVMLRYKSRQNDLAQQLAYGYLLRKPPAAAVNRLREVLFACWQEQHVGADEYLTAFQINMRGGEVHFGLAPADEVAKREESSQALLWRAAEYEAGLPPRERGLPPPSIVNLTQLYASVPMPGSFKLQFKVKSRAVQMGMDPHDPTATFVPGGEPLVHRAVELVQTISAASEDDFAAAVPDPLYRVCFLKLVRELAPDGKRVEQVDVGGGRSKWRSADIPREARAGIGRRIRLTFEKAGYVSSVGLLTGMNLKDQRLQLTVENGSRRRDTWSAPREPELAAKVATLWGRKVLVAGVAETTLGGHQRLTLVDIQEAPMDDEGSDGPVPSDER